MTAACTDIRGFNNESNQNTWDGRFYDNGEYIGDDEPDMTFLSHRPGSGNDVTWTDTIGRDRLRRRPIQIRATTSRIGSS